jgi:hypothetical protein
VSPKFVEPLALLTIILVTEELIISCLAVIEPSTVKLPFMSASVLTVKPLLGDIDAETLPDVI